MTISIVSRPGRSSRRGGSGRQLIVSLCTAVMLAACVSSVPPPRPAPAAAATVRPASQRPATPRPVPVAVVPNPNDPRNAPSPQLVQTIRSLGAGFGGHVGIAVMRTDGGWVAAYNGNDLFPQQSVSKLWVAMTLLDSVDRKKLSLSDTATITRRDLVVFHQPSAANVGESGWTTTLSDLLGRAMKQSDNLANDTLLRTVGGPESVRSFLARRFVGNVRFGPGERVLQATTAGLTWQQSYSNGRNFLSARAALPMSARNRALDNYLADPPDGAAPAAIVTALSKLKRGEMLSSTSTRLLLSIMEEAKTGPQRIKGGVPAGWSYLHKTGTGQDLPPRSTGYNDIGIMTAPDGTSYAVAVMIGETTKPIPARWTLMQSVARAVVAMHEAR